MKLVPGDRVRLYSVQLFRLHREERVAREDDNKKKRELQRDLLNFQVVEKTPGWWLHPRVGMLVLVPRPAQSHSIGAISFPSASAK